MNQMTNTHILLHRFVYLEPRSLPEAITLLAQYGERAQLLAGGTDLLVHMKIERSAPEVIISINNIPGLDAIAVGPNHLSLGARTSIISVERDPRVQACFPALAEACASFSTTQVQTMGTLGGNVGNGSPASDTAPALIACGAQIELAGPGGARQMPLEHFFIKPGKTALKPAELITAFHLPRPAQGTGSAFIKISRVAADIAKASVAVSLVRDPRDPGRVLSARLAFGSVAPVPLRAPKTEALLAGQPFDEALAAEVAAAAALEITPISDVRSTAQYRRDVVRAMTYDALRIAWQRAGLPDPDVWDIQLAGTATTADSSATPSRRIEVDEKQLITLTVNGQPHQVWIASNELLLNVLRDRLQLTGAKYGCGIGECSACTVLYDGKPMLSCLLLAVAAKGHDIRTVEGLEAPNGDLDPVQEAFIEYTAYQCGYCTPGMLLTAKSLLTENNHPTEDDVRHYLRGNLCRCTGYANIVRAVLSCVEPD